MWIHIDAQPKELYLSSHAKSSSSRLKVIKCPLYACPPAFFVVFLMLSGPLRSDPHPEDSVSRESVPEVIVPKRPVSGAELYIDYGKLAALVLPQENKLEWGLHLRFYERLVLAGEFGRAMLEPNAPYENTVFYRIEGNWNRLGLDYYTSLDPKNFYYAGFRYGLSRFSDQGEVLVSGDPDNQASRTFGSDNMNASWLELLVGSEMRLSLIGSKSEDPVHGLFLGWKFRFRVLLDMENREEYPVFAIPGYGRTFDKTIPALNLYLKYRFGR